MLTKIDDLTAFERLKERFLPDPSQAPEGSRPKWTVGHLLPLGYEAYCKILHPMYEDTSITNRDLTWQDWEQQQEKPALATPTEKAIAHLLQGAIIERESGGSPEHRQRVTWRELARGYGRAFGPE